MKIYKIWKYPKEGWIFKIRFGSRKHLRVHAGGETVFFDTSSDMMRGFFFPYYQDGESLEPNVISIFLETIKRDSVFIDIGAFVGSYALVASKFCTHGSVHAFEVNPLMINELRKNSRLNNISNLNVVCAAVWDESGKVISFDEMLDGDNSTNSVREAAANRLDRVISIRIDRYCEQMRLFPTVVKIDVEGAEVRVLKGMENVLRYVETLFLEIHPDWLGRYGNTLDEIAAILRPQEFVVQAVLNRRESTDAQLVRVDDIRGINENIMLVCTRPIQKKSS